MAHGSPINKFQIAGTILKISCVRCHFVKSDIHFLGLPYGIFFSVITDNFTSIALERCKKEYSMVSIILVQGFCPLKIKITQFPDGFRFNSS